MTAEDAAKARELSIIRAQELAIELEELLDQPELSVEWKGRLLLTTAQIANFLLIRYIAESE